MTAPAILAEHVGSVPDSGGGAILIWVLLAFGIVGLYLIIRRTQRRSYDDIMTREQREAEMRANDPDMKHDDTP